MKCPNCGKSIPSGKLFSGYCGNRIEAEQKPPKKEPVITQPEAQPAKNPQVPLRKVTIQCKPHEGNTRKKKSMLIAVLVTVLLISAVVAYQMLGPTQHTIQCMDFGYSEGVWHGLSNTYSEGMDRRKFRTIDSYEINFDWVTHTESQVIKFDDDMNVNIFLNNQDLNSIASCVNPNYVSYSIDLDSDEISDYSKGYVCEVKGKYLHSGENIFRAEFTWSDRAYDGEYYYGPGTDNEKVTGTCRIFVQ